MRVAPGGRTDPHLVAPGAREGYGAAGRRHIGGEEGGVWLGAGDETVLQFETECATPRAAGSWSASGARLPAEVRRAYSAGGSRRVSRGTVVMALMATIATLCTKMLAVDQRPRPQEALARTLLRTLAHRKDLAMRAVHQELIFEPLQKIYDDEVGNRIMGKNSSKISLASPLILDNSYKQYSTPHLPPVPMTRNDLLADARSVGDTLEVYGTQALEGTELEVRKVAEQMLVSQFQPEWLLGRDADKVASVGGGKMGGGVSSALGSSYTTKGINPVKFLQPPEEDTDPEIKRFMHDLRHGIENKNSSGLHSSSCIFRTPCPCLPPLNTLSSRLTHFSENVIRSMHLHNCNHTPIPTPSPKPRPSMTVFPKP